MQPTERELFVSQKILYDSGALGVLKFTSKIQKESGGRYLETGGLIKGLAVDPVIEWILKDLGVDPEDVWKKVDEKTGSVANRLDKARETLNFFSKDGKLKFYQRGTLMSGALQDVLSAARKACKKRGSSEITCLDLLMGITLSGKGFAYEVLKELGIGRITLMTRIKKEQGLNDDLQYRDTEEIHISSGFKKRVRRLIRGG